MLPEREPRQCCLAVSGSIAWSRGGSATHFPSLRAQLFDALARCCTDRLKSPSAGQLRKQILRFAQDDHEKQILRFAQDDWLL